MVAMAINLVLGVLYSWSVFASALVGQRGWNKADASLPFTVSTIAFAVTMIFAGRLQDKRGPRIAATLGALMLGAGLILSAYAPAIAAATGLGQVLLISLGYGLIGGIGIGLGYSATTPPSVKWFSPSRKGLIAGLVVAGVGLSAVYMAPLTKWLLKATGAFAPSAITPDPISNTFLVLGIGTIVIVLILATMLRNPPAGYVPAAAAAPTSAAKAKAISGRDIGPAQMLRTPQFWLLWLTFILAAAPGLMLISQMAIIAPIQIKVPGQAAAASAPARAIAPVVASGSASASAPTSASAPVAKPVQAAWGILPVMLLAIFNTCGRVVGGLVSDRLGRTRTMMLAFIVLAANMFEFANYTTAPMLMFGACLAGLCYGTLFTLMPMASADFYGLKNLGMNYGLLFTAFGVAGTVGPRLAGKVCDWTGSYANSYPWLAGMVLVAAVLAFITRAPKASAQTPAA